MKFKIMACLQVVLMLFMLCVPSISMASVSTDISLLLNKTSAAVGETVTASGTAAPNAWVPLKVVDAAQNIVLFDTTKADANGNYSIDIVIPAGASGTLTVIVGEGSNVATGSLTVTGAPQAVTLNLSKTEASVGETVTASGTAAPNAWVPLKVVDAAQNIVLFDTTKADANGNYSIDIVIPAGASGTLTVIVGEGSNVATGSLTVTGAPQAVTLNLSKTEASVGETVTASGTAAPNAWVPLKVVDAAQNIVLFDTTKADANGNYSIDIVIPAGASGTLTVIVGEGSNVATKSLTVTETPPVDTEAPVWTDGSLIASNITQTTLTLSWSGATDNVGVTGYKVYQDGTLLTETPVSGTSYEVTGLSAGTEYTFKVEAVDAAGNESTDGPVVTVTTEEPSQVEVTLELSKTEALVGETVTASGTAAPNAWVPIKIVDASQSILFFDTTKADASGNYSIDIVIPEGASGTLTVIAGEGSNVATKSLIVTETPPVDTEAPVWVNGSLIATDITQTTLTLSWSGATDNVGVTGYKVYQDGTLLTETPVSGTSYEVTGLSAGTEYTFKVEAVDAAGNESTDGPVVTVTTEEPSQVEVTLELSKTEALVGETVTASGTAAPNAWVPIKIVDASQSILFFDTTKADASGNYSIDIVIPEGASGTLTVIAGEGSNVATKSLIVTETPPVDTEAPVWVNGSLIATDITQTTITLSWSSATDNVGVTGYKVYQDGSLLTETPVSGTSYEVTGLSAGTEYTFKVEAVDAAGNESTDGPVVTVTTEEPSQVEVTLELSKTEALVGETVTASGTAAPNAWVPIKIVDASQSILFFDTTKADASGNYSIDIVIPEGASGTLTVIAGEGSNVATKSLIVTETPPVDTEAPVWVNGSLIATDITQTTITLSWSGATDNVGVTGYKVYQDGSLLTETPVSGTSYEVTGLSAGTEYTFKVEAVDAAGNESTDGPVVTVITAAAPDTEAPVWVNGSLIATDITQTTITLSWSSATDNVGVTGYKVYQDGSLLTETPVSGTSYEVTGLSAGTEYTFKVEAVDAAGNESTDGPSVTVSTAAAPDTEAPVWTDGSLIASNITQTTITLSWSSATDNVGVTGYKVYQDGSLLTETPVSGTSYEVTGLSAGTEYTFKVEAVDAAGNESTDGPSVTVSTAAAPDTEAPVWVNGSLIATDITQTTITLSWSGATDNVGVTGYKVYQDGSLLTETPVSGTSYEVTGLSAGTEYTFKVEAVDAAGNESTDGPSITVSTKMEIVAKPSAWPLGGAVVKGTEVTLKTATAGATIYYTEDGSNPTPESKAYTSPITINGPVTIKAIAVKAGMANSDIMTESYTIAEPILEPEVTIKPDGSNKELAITQDTQNLSAPVQINVPGNVTDAIISVTALMNEPDPDTGMVTTDELPALNINASTEISATAPVKVEIPAGASIEAPANWNGNINVPRVEEKTSVKVTPDPGMTATVDSVIEIGFGDVPLTFNRAVRILIPGKAGKDAGYYRGDQFFKISSLPPGALDTQEWANNNIPDGGDGKLDVGDDLVIWTKHFTKFVTYTQTKTSTGGGSSSQPVTSTTGTATVKPGVGGTISLGDEATIKVPANALTGTSAVEVKIQKVTTPPAVPAGFKLASNVYEFSVGGENSYNFARAVTITLSFDPEALNPGEKPEIYYFDEAAEQWVNIGGTVYGNTISVQLDHFTKFAVLVAGEGEQQPTFNDIAGHWAADNINQLVGLGAINGYPDGSFKPDNNITRAEFTTILVRAFQLTSKDGKTFPDTAVHWARDYIAAAADNGVVNGYDTGFFGPDDLITREQMAVMVVNAAKLPAASGELRFDDSSSISGWAREAIVTATHNGIMQGYPDNTIQPLGNATRAEAVTVIVKALTGR